MLCRHAAARGRLERCVHEAVQMSLAAFWSLVGALQRVHGGEFNGSLAAVYICSISTSKSDMLETCTGASAGAHREMYWPADTRCRHNQSGHGGRSTSGYVPSQILLAGVRQTRMRLAC